MFNPAFLTFTEYRDLVDPDHKWHTSDAYQMDVASFGEKNYYKKDLYPKLLRRVKINGIYFEFRLRIEVRQYVAYGDDGEILRDDKGLAVIMSDEEALAAGKEPDKSICVFNDEGQPCAAFQDEWGCVLIMVASEYRGFGIGPILGRLARTIYPDKPSGGFTKGGYNNFVKVYREMVREALTTGAYAAKVRGGEMTMARVREIVGSAGLENRPVAKTVNHNMNDPKDWLVYVGGYGDFIVYDKKLKDFVNESSDSDADESWIDKAIKGIILVREPRDGHFIVVQFGGDTDKIKTFLMSCGITYAADHGAVLDVDPEDVKYVSKDIADLADDPNALLGHTRYETIPKALLDLRPMEIVEKRYRASFDQYDEFKNRMMELAYSKFQKSVHEGLVMEDVFHGSPHQFVDFSHHNANKGSGSHMYGWGLYFADTRQMAMHYRDSKPVFIINGKRVVVPVNWEDVEQTPEAYLAKSIHSSSSAVLSLEAGAKGKIPTWYKSPEIAEKALELAKTAKIERTRGIMYSVSIPEVEDMLNWDEELGRQPPKVLAAIKQADLIPTGPPRVVKDPHSGFNVMVGWAKIGWSLYQDDAEAHLEDDEEPFDPMTHLTGSGLYRGLSEHFGSDEAASRYLNKLGIVGLTYENTGSLGGQNYVIFDASNAEIKASEEGQKYNID